MSADEKLDVILAKLDTISDPFVIPESARTVLADMGKHGGYHYTYMVGYGAYPFSLDTVINPNGHLVMYLRDCEGSAIWRAELHGPEAGHAAAHP